MLFVRLSVCHLSLRSDGKGGDGGDGGDLPSLERRRDTCEALELTAESRCPIHPMWIGTQINTARQVD